MIILGAGGVVPSLIYALKKMNVSKIYLGNRTRKKAEYLKLLFENLEIIDWGDLPDFDIIINATSLGLKENDKFGIDFAQKGNNKLFYDVIYNPKETEFLKDAKSFGNIVENGKMMFIYQAHQAFSVWHKILPEIDNEVIKIVQK